MTFAIEYIIDTNFKATFEPRLTFDYANSVGKLAAPIFIVLLALCEINVSKYRAYISALLT